MADGAQEEIRAGRRKRIKELEVMVADVITETPDTTTLVLFTGNDALDYEAGHFLTIDPHQFASLHRWAQYLEDQKGRKEPARAYSLASAPHEKYLAITVKEESYVSGRTRFPPLLSPVLVRRTPRGTRMVVTGFTGPYTMPADLESRTDHLVHICAGSGIVPNFSIIKHALHHGMKLRHTLIYGNKSWDEVIYRDELQRLAAAHPDQLKIVHTLSRDAQAQSRGANVRYGRVDAELIRAHIPDPSAVHVFTCGPGLTKWDKAMAKEKGEEAAPRFLESVLAALEGIGVGKKQISRESYG